MGSKISVDKHVSNIEDILEMNPLYFSKLKTENNIPASITQHIKVWRYYEDEKKAKAIKSAPICLKDTFNSNFAFNSNECYLVLYIYKKSGEEPVAANDFMESMWEVIESYSNLTPRGLETPIASSESMSTLNRDAFESFFVPKRPVKQSESKFEYMIFLWNGKTANSLMKSMAFSAALDLDTLINKTREQFLQVLFSGGYIRNKKLWMGKILQLDSSEGHKKNNTDLEKKVSNLRGAVYLLNFLFPKAEGRGMRPEGFKERFLQGRPLSNSDDDYMLMDDGNDDDYVEEQSPMDSPASLIRRESGNFDESPLETVRAIEPFHPKIPKLPIFTPKYPFEEENIAQRVMENDFQPKKMIPKLNIGGAFDKPLNLNKNLEAQMKSESDHDETQEEDSQILSIPGNIDSQDSMRKADKNGVLEQPLPTRGFNLNIGGARNEPKERSSEEEGEGEEERDQAVDDDDDDDERESVTRPKKIILFSGQCNEILEGFLYVGGEIIANNEKILSEVGITHIVNAAGDACENRFPEKIKYLTLYLKDSRGENIECVFYDVIDFLDSVKQENGKVLVHCVQGISRSVALCISYLICRHGHTYTSALNYIRDRRGIASPNPAFWAQLVNFQNRLKGSFEEVPAPRVFCVGSFQRETPQTIVARFIINFTHVANNKPSKLLDPRAVFIFQSEEKLYLWIGNKILPANRERYIAKAESHIKLLQKYESAPETYLTINQNEEPAEFWDFWKIKFEERYLENKEWDLWFVDLATHKNVVGTTLYEDESDDSSPVSPIVHAELYCYPTLEPLKSVNIKELNPNNLLILCTQKGNDKAAYVWRGISVPQEVEDKLYLANVLRQKWPDTDSSNIAIFEEIPTEETDTFFSHFQGEDEDTDEEEFN